MLSRWNFERRHIDEICSQQSNVYFIYHHHQRVGRKGSCYILAFSSSTSFSLSDSRSSTHGKGREGEGRGGVRKLRVFFRSSHNLFIVVLAHLSSSPQSRSLRNPAAVLNILSPSLLL